MKQNWTFKIQLSRYQNKIFENHTPLKDTVTRELSILMIGFTIRINSYQTGGDLLTERHHFVMVMVQNV